MFGQLVVSAVGGYVQSGQPAEDRIVWQRCLRRVLWHQRFISIGIGAPTGDEYCPRAGQRGQELAGQQGIPGTTGTSGFQRRNQQWRGNWWVNEVMVHVIDWFSI